MSLIGQSVTILGAGIAGLAVARALAMRGAAVTVLEQADAIREVGAGMQISPNGAVVLRALGLGAALDAAGTLAEAVQLIDGPTGDKVLRLDLRARPGRLSLSAPRRPDRASCSTARRGGRGPAPAATDRRGRSFRAAPRLTTAQGDRIDAGLLIGADGLHSRVRAALNGAATARLHRSGRLARCCCPPTPGEPAVAEVHMGPGRHLVSYPMRGGTLRNIVAVEERSRWAEEGWSLRDDPMELRLAFAGLLAPRARLAGRRSRMCYLWGLFRHPVARHWHGGRCAILGDAAHPTLPFLAQGANMALEDAWVLAHCLADHDEPAGRLWRLPAGRVPPAAPGSSRRAAAMRAPTTCTARGVTRPMPHCASAVGLAPDAPLQRFDWLYRHDVTV